MFLKEKLGNPGAMTPLYAAVAKTIKHAESISKKGDKVMIMIDTDGYENASKEQTRESIKALVETRTKAGWEFLFMASGMDRAQAMNLGIAGQAMGMHVKTDSHVHRMQTYASSGTQTTACFSGGQTGSFQPDDEDDEEKKVSPFFAPGSRTGLRTSQ